MGATAAEDSILFIASSVTRLFMQKISNIEVIVAKEANNGTITNIAQILNFLATFSENIRQQF